MLGIKIGEEFLELPPASEMQIEENNPLLDFTNEVKGEYSYPISAKLTPRNLKILQGSGFFQKKETNPGVAAQAFTDTLQYSIGKIKIEKTQPNLNNKNDTGLNLIYLSGYSSFFQDIKGKKLRDINTGGDRIFAGDNFNEAGAGFWGHIHQVLHAAPGYGTSGYDYAFYLVENEDFGESPNGKDILNYLAYTGPSTYKFNLTTVDTNWLNLVCPFPYLKYILVKAIEYCGWRIEGSILNDPDFLKITMINSQCIDYGYYGWDGATNFHMHASVKFNLSNHLPDILIGDFITWLANRLGFWYDFDKKKKLITITALGDFLNGEQKDFTKFTNPRLEKTILTEKETYAIKVGGASAEVSFAGVQNMGQVNTFTGLPAAAAAIANHVYLVVDQNVYYICQPKEGTNDWLWDVYASNNGSVVPANATKDISTNCLIPDMSEYKTNTGFLVPNWSEEGNWPGHKLKSFDDIGEYTGSLVIAFYHGLKRSAGGVEYPFASPHIYDSQGNQVGNWSLSLKAKKFDGSEIGLYDIIWKPVLEKLSPTEEVELTLVDFPLEEWLNLKWTDQLIIDGVKLLVKTRKPVLSYKNTLQLTCMRL